MHVWCLIKGQLACWQGASTDPRCHPPGGLTGFKFTTAQGKSLALGPGSHRTTLTSSSPMSGPNMKLLVPAALLLLAFLAVTQVKAESACTKDDCDTIDLSGNIAVPASRNRKLLQSPGFGNGNGNGNGNIGSGNGNNNGNWNTGFLNGNGNGNFNTGFHNGNYNGNGNWGALNGNNNGNGNLGAFNGNGNGNVNDGVGNGNNNGNNNGR